MFSVNVRAKHNWRAQKLLLVILRANRMFFCKNKTIEAKFGTGGEDSRFSTNTNTSLLVKKKEKKVIFLFSSQNEVICGEN